MKYDFLIVGAVFAHVRPSASLYQEYKKLTDA